MPGLLTIVTDSFSTLFQTQVSKYTCSETVRLTKRTELCGVLGHYWSLSLGRGFISAAPLQGAPGSGVWGPFL